MNPRNLVGRGTLQSGMQSVSAKILPRLRGLESLTLTSFQTTSGQVEATSVDEQVLVERAKAGDQEAFGTLVRLHQRQIYSLALRMLRDAEEASEATQEVFLAAWQGLRGYRGDARFATWLYRIAYNYCLRLSAQHRREVAAQRRLSAESAREWSPASTLSAHHAENAEREMREAVRSEIANLPPKYRLVVVLRHLQELSYEEMSEVMRVPIGTVKTHLFRARAMLKERLEGLGRVREEGLARAEGLRAGLEAGLRGMLDSGRQAPRHSEEGP